VKLCRRGLGQLQARANDFIGAACRFEKEVAQQVGAGTGGTRQGCDSWAGRSPASRASGWRPGLLSAARLTPPAPPPLLRSLCHPGRVGEAVQRERQARDAGGAGQLAQGGRGGRRPAQARAGQLAGGAGHGQGGGQPPAQGDGAGGGGAGAAAGGGAQASGAACARRTAGGWGRCAGGALGGGKGAKGACFS
jgi:hypothetical protein